MGGGIIAAITGIVLSILLALLGIIYFPIKRAIKRRTEAKSADDTDRREQEPQREIESQLIDQSADIEASDEKTTNTTAT